MNKLEDLKRRLLAKIVKGDGCWTWVGAKSPNGYGHGWYDGRQQLAHRLSYMVHVGPIPDGLNVLHKCDNRICVNPEHLWVGTQKENLRDMMVKGRAFHLSGDDHPYRKNPNLVARGERAGKAKLTAGQVQSIRSLCASGITKKELGERYGVSAQSIGDIILGKSWTHIP